MPWGRLKRGKGDEECGRRNCYFIRKRKSHPDKETLQAETTAKTPNVRGEAHLVCVRDDKKTWPQC